MFAIHAKHRIQTDESHSSPGNHEEWFYMVKQPARHHGTEDVRYIIGGHPPDHAGDDGSTTTSPTQTAMQERSISPCIPLWSKKGEGASPGGDGGDAAVSGECESIQQVHGILPHRIAEIVVRWATEEGERAVSGGETRHPRPTYFIAELTMLNTTATDTADSSETTATATLSRSGESPLAPGEVVVLQDQSQLELQTTTFGATTTTTLTFTYHPIVASLDPELPEPTSTVLRHTLHDYGITVQPEPLLPTTKLFEPGSPSSPATGHASPVLFGLYVTEATGSQQPLPTAWLALAKGYLFVSPQGLLEWLRQLTSRMDRRCSPSHPPPSLFGLDGPAERDPPLLALHIPPANALRYVCAAVSSPLSVSGLPNTANACFPTSGGSGEEGSGCPASWLSTWLTTGVPATSENVAQVAAGRAVTAPYRQRSPASPLPRRSLFRRAHVFTATDSVVSQVPSLPLILEMCGAVSVLDARMTDRARELVVDRLRVLLASADEEEEEEEKEEESRGPFFASMQEPILYIVVDVETAVCLDLVFINDGVPDFSGLRDAGDRGEVPQELVELLHALRQEEVSLARYYGRAAAPRLWRLISSDDIFVGLMANSLDALPYSRGSTRVVAQEHACHDAENGGMKTPEAQRQLQYTVEDEEGATTTPRAPHQDQDTMAATATAGGSAGGRPHPSSSSPIAVPALFLLSPSQPGAHGHTEYPQHPQPSLLTPSQNRRSGSTAAMMRYFGPGGPGYAASLAPSSAALSAGRGSSASSRRSTGASGRGVPGSFLPRGGDRTPTGAQMRAHHRRRRVGSAGSSGSTDGVASSRGFLTPVGSPRREERFGTSRFSFVASTEQGSVTPLQRRGPRRRAVLNCVAAATPSRGAGHRATSPEANSGSNPTAGMPGDEPVAVAGGAPDAEPVQQNHTTTTNNNNSIPAPVSDEASMQFHQEEEGDVVVAEAKSSTQHHTEVVVPVPATPTSSAPAAAGYEYDFLRVHLYAFLVREGPKVDSALQMYRRCNYLNVDAVDHALDCAATAEEYLDTIERLHHLEVRQDRGTSQSSAGNGHPVKPKTLASTNDSKNIGRLTGTSTTSCRGPPPPPAQSTSRMAFGSSRPLRPRRIDALELFHADCTALWQKSSYLVLQWDRQGRPPLPKRLGVVRRHQQVREDERMQRDECAAGSVTPRQRSVSARRSPSAGRRSATPTRPPLTHETGVLNTQSGRKTTSGLLVLSTPCQARAHREWYQRSSLVESRPPKAPLQAPPPPPTQRPATSNSKKSTPTASRQRFSQPSSEGVSLGRMPRATNGAINTTTTNTSVPCTSIKSSTPSATSAAPHAATLASADSPSSVHLHLSSSQQNTSGAAALNMGSASNNNNNNNTTASSQDATVRKSKRKAKRTSR